MPATNFPAMIPAPAPAGPVVILHNIRSLHNVGSIFRTADGAGFSRVYLCGITPEPTDKLGRLRSDFAKVALGAEGFVAWEKVDRVTPLIARLRKQGYVIYAVEQDSRSLPFNRWSQVSGRKRSAQNSKIALIMGSEVDGLPKSVLDKADHILEIPMRGGKESLNVAVAFGVAAYKIC